MTGYSNTHAGGCRAGVKPWQSPATLLLAGLAASVLLLIMTGCASQPNLPADALAREREALMHADREFSRMSGEKGAVAAFEHFFAEDAVALPAGAPPLRGREAIIKAMSEGPPETLSWNPLESGVSDGGDLGYTFGTYESRGQGPDGKPRVTTGKYTSVWRKQKDGTWKIVLDLGNQTPAAPAK